MKCQILLLAVLVMSTQAGAQDKAPSGAGDEPTPVATASIDPRAVAELARRDGLSEDAARRYAESGCDGGTTPAMTYCAEYCDIPVCPSN